MATETHGKMARRHRGAVATGEPQHDRLGDVHLGGDVDRDR